MVFNSDAVEAQAEISRLQEELDDQREECYGHLKVMQQLKVPINIGTTKPAAMYIQ